MKYHQNRLRIQLEIDERTYGSIGRERSLAFAGWKYTPVIDLVAVLNDERAYEAMLKERRQKERRPGEQGETGKQC